jgi:hypothetical protein
MTRLHRRHEAIKAALRRGAAEVVDGPIHHTVLVVAGSDDAAARLAHEYVRHLEADEVRTARPEDVLEHAEPPEGGFLTVVVPELVQEPSLTEVLRRRRALELKVRLRDDPGVVVTDVPVLAEPGATPERVDPDQSAAFLIVRAVDDATVHAVNYSRALHAFPTRALFFELYPDSAEEVVREWERRELPLRLEVVDCPFRELGGPLLERLRAVTRRRDAIAAVVAPEVVTGSVLGDRRSLYLKWLLLYEPRTVLSTVPYVVSAPQSPPRGRAPARAGALPRR